MTFLNSVTGCVSQCTWTTAALATGTLCSTAALVALRCTSSKRKAIEEISNRAVSLSYVSEARAARTAAIGVADAAIAAIGKNSAQLKADFELAKKALTDATTAQEVVAAVRGLSQLINRNQAEVYQNKEGEDVRYFTAEQITSWIGAGVKGSPKTATADAVAAVAPGILVKAAADITAGLDKLREKTESFAIRDTASQAKDLKFYSPAKHSPRREEIAFGVAALVSFCVAGGLWYTGTPVWTPAASVVGVKA